MAPVIGAALALKVGIDGQDSWRHACLVCGDGYFGLSGLTILKSPLMLSIKVPALLVPATLYLGI